MSTFSAAGSPHALSSRILRFLRTGCQFRGLLIMALAECLGRYRQARACLEDSSSGLVAVMCSSFQPHINNPLVTTDQSCPQEKSCSALEVAANVSPRRPLSEGADCNVTTDRKRKDMGGSVRTRRAASRSTLEGVVPLSRLFTKLSKAACPSVLLRLQETRQSMPPCDLGWPALSVL